MCAPIESPLPSQHHTAGESVREFGWQFACGEGFAEIAEVIYQLRDRI